MTSDGNQRNRRPFRRKGNNKNNNNNQKGSSKGKSQINKEIKFNLHGTGKEKQNCSYAKVVEKICLRLQQNLTNGGSNIVKSIRENKVCRPEAPTRKESQLADKDKKEFEQKSLDKEYDARLKHYIAKDEDFDENWMKSYAYIFESYCSKDMQVAIKELPNYESEIQNEPLKLLEEVKKLMHTSVRARYPFMSLTENLASLVNFKQNEKEPLCDYLERFEQDKCIVKSQMGDDVLDTFMESYPSYDSLGIDEKKTLKKSGFEAWMAAIFLRGSNQSVYGELMKDYRKDYANNDDNYPKTVRGMVDVMRQLKPKPKKDDKSNKNRNGNGNKDKDKDGSSKESSFATKSACWCCGKPGCISKNCKIADDIPRNQWFDRSGIVHYTETNQEQDELAETRQQDSPCRDNACRSSSRRSTDRSSRQLGERSTSVGWSMLQIHQSKGKIIGKKSEKKMQNWHDGENYVFSSLEYFTILLGRLLSR